MCCLAGRWTPTVRITNGFAAGSITSGLATGSSSRTSSARNASRSALASANSRAFMRLRSESTRRVVAVMPTSAVSSAVSMASRRSSSRRGLRENRPPRPRAMPLPSAVRASPTAGAAAAFPGQATGGEEGASANHGRGVLCGVGCGAFAMAVAAAQHPHASRASQAGPLLRLGRGSADPRVLRPLQALPQPRQAPPRAATPTATRLPPPQPRRRRRQARPAPMPAATRSRGRAPRPHARARLPPRPLRARLYASRPH